MIPLSIKIEIKSKYKDEAFPDGVYGRVSICPEHEYNEGNPDNLVFRDKRLLLPPSASWELPSKATKAELSALLSNLTSEFALTLRSYLIHELHAEKS